MLHTCPTQKRLQTEFFELSQIHHVLQGKYQERVMGLSWMPRPLREYFKDITAFAELYRYPEDSPALQRHEYEELMRGFFEALASTAKLFPQGNGLKGDVALLLKNLNLHEELWKYLHECVPTKEVFDFSTPFPKQNL